MWWLVATSVAALAVWSNTILDEEVQDGLVGLNVGVLQVQAVASTWNDADLEWRSVLEVGLGRLWDALEAGWWGEAVTAAEWHVTLTGNDVHWGLDWVWRACSAANGEELTNSHRLSSHETDWQESWVEVTWSEKVDVDTLHGSWCKVTVWQGGELWVGVGLAEVASEKEVGKEGTILGETSKTKTVGDGRVLSSQDVALDRAK